VALRIDYTEAALDDLAEITRYGAFNFGLKAARAYSQSLLDATEILATFPMAGAATTDPLSRVLISQSHRLVYRVEPESILILRILHARQMPQELE